MFVISVLVHDFMINNLRNEIEFIFEKKQLTTLIFVGEIVTVIDTVTDVFRSVAASVSAMILTGGWFRVCVSM